MVCKKNLSCSIETTPAKQPTKPEWYNVVSGRQVLIAQGVPRSTEADAECESFCTTLHPRTAVGLSNKNNKLIIAVAEGRRQDAVGVTLYELGQVMLKFGASNAINLDGGGSSSLVLNGRRVSARPENEPNERPVANALGIFVKSGLKTISGVGTEGGHQQLEPVETQDFEN